MNKTYAVGYINFFDNDLIIEIISAPNWYEALHKHSKMQGERWISNYSLEEAKIEAFNADMMIDVKEIPIG